MQVSSKAFDKRKIPLWIKRLGKSSKTLCSGMNSSFVSHTESFKMDTNMKKVFKVPAQYLWSRKVKLGLPTPQSYTSASGPLTLAHVSSNRKPGATLKKVV